MHLKSYSSVANRPEVGWTCLESGFASLTIVAAIDVWAAGMILLFFLSGKFPLFQSNDDIEALMEIAAIIGRKQMERTATLHSMFTNHGYLELATDIIQGRLFISNVPAVLGDGITWREFVTKQNPDVYKPKEPDLRYYPFNTPAYRAYLQEEAERAQHPPPSSSPTSPTIASSTTLPPAPSTITKPDSIPTLSPSTTLPPASHSLFSPEQHASDVDSAFDLLEQLLHPESTKRITPKRALAHPFLAGKPDEEDALPDDDEFVPHEFGEGVCGKLHFRDEVTDEMCVRVKVRCECGECEGVEREEVRTLKPGEGVAIGRQPCEFHEDMDLEF